MTCPMEMRILQVSEMTFCVKQNRDFSDAMSRFSLISLLHQKKVQQNALCHKCIGNISWFADLFHGVTRNIDVGDEAITEY